MITGDLVDFGKVPAEELSPLATLEVPIFFCIGNHERYVDCDDICARLEGHGVRVLREAVDCSQASLVVAGSGRRGVAADTRRRGPSGSGTPRRASGSFSTIARMGLKRRQRPAST